MDDAVWAWPAWKFGMKRDDLFTTLHDRYNTFTFTLQDPEAFHHDVYELSRDAETPQEFHRLMSDRHQQRLRELNDSLEALALEIIANPKLMASEQWQHALQLFRTKSYDSIVRYFASYVPDDYLDRHDSQSTSSYSSFSEADSVRTMSTNSSSDENHPPCPHFLDDDVFPSCHGITEEPSDIDDRVCHDHIPETLASPSQPDAANSASSVSSPSDLESQSYTSTNPPSRSMSFSGSELGLPAPVLMQHGLGRGHDDDETSQVGDGDGAVIIGACDSGSGGCRSSCDGGTGVLAGQSRRLDNPHVPSDAMESATPTPRQESAAATCYMEHKFVATRRVRSPRQSSPSSKSHTAGRTAASPVPEVRRTPEEALSKIQKPLQDALRKRPRGRRRVE